MYFKYESDRLIIKVLDEAYACAVLNFVQTNKSYFEQFEASKPHNFYTAAFQSHLLNAEYTQFMTKKYIRYYIFKKNNPKEIIGTISFANFLQSPYMSCIIGYKFSPEFQHMGFATESLELTIHALFTEMDIHRIEAFILPNNAPSIKLAERLGFIFEGVSRELILINGIWQDHLRYVLINHST